MSYNQITDIFIVIEQSYDHYCFKAVGINLSFCKYRPTVLHVFGNYTASFTRAKDQSL